MYAELLKHQFIMHRVAPTLSFRPIPYCSTGGPFLIPPTLPRNSPFGPRDLLWLLVCALGVLVDKRPRLALMLVLVDRASTLRGASPVGIPATLLREKMLQPIVI